MNLANMKVGVRLGLGFALVLCLLVAVTVVGILRMAQIQDRLDHVVSVNNVVTRLVVDMRNNVSERVTSLRILTLMTDPADMEPELNRFKEQTAKYDALQRSWPPSSRQKRRLKKNPCWPRSRNTKAWPCRPSPRLGTVPGQQRRWTRPA